MGASEAAVPFELVMSGRHSAHDAPAITVFRSLDAWRDHWALMHEGHGYRHLPCPEPDLSGSMLIEVAGGTTWTGLAEIEAAALTLDCGVLTVGASLRYPPGIATRDQGSPFVILKTPVHDGTVALDLSVLHGIQRVAPSVPPI